MNKPKISVVMPVYNMSGYLDESLSSWSEQTFREIEIICVDDASTDGSYEQLLEWSQKDARIRVHRFETNRSAWAARKWGIAHARGEYILFADADDTMEQRACQELYGQMTRDPVDILHFNANIVNAGGLPEARIDGMKKFVAPYPGTLRGSAIFTACFQEKKYQFSLWNKLFSAELCRRAIEDTKDDVLPKAQDKALYWVLALNAETYRGEPHKSYYNYFFGRGGTGHNSLTMKQFERYCTMADTANAMHEYLEDKNLLEQYREVDRLNRQALLNDCVSRFRNEVDDAMKARAFDRMLDKWGAAEVVSALAREEWFNRYAVARYLRGAQALRCDRRDIKVIAAYYHSCANGGAQRVMCDLCLLFDAMGYQVVAITDEEPSDIDYPLPPTAKRVVLPHHAQANRQNYGARAAALEETLREYNVDVLLYHAWVSNLMLWDELVCKANHVGFIAHCHNIFSLPVLRSSYKSVFNVIAPYLLADAVVALSKTDRYYWLHFNKNVHVTVNPMAADYSDWRVSDALDEKQILWIGRLSPEKRPYDALFIMKRVLEKVPDAHLHIVGSSPNEKYMNDLRKKIQTMGLSQSVTMHGFQADVESFYRRASLFLMTSEYEGYSLTLQESKLAGLPCVMYDLPYLTLCEGHRGIVSVTPGSTKEAAAAIVDLLTDAEKRHGYAKDARAHIEELMGYDFRGKWTQILSSVGGEGGDDVPEESHTMLETLLGHHERSLQEALRKGGGIQMHASPLARKVAGGIQCCCDHGFLYTVKYAFVKLFRYFSSR